MDKTNSPINVCIVAGGSYSEFHVSIAMTKFAIQSLGSVERFKLSLIIIEQDFQVIEQDPYHFIPSVTPDDIFYALEKNPTLYRENAKATGTIASLLAPAVEKADVILPLMQGPLGEDGAIQGFIKIFNKPFASVDVLGSSLCKDKEIQKRILQSNGLPVIPFLAFRASEYFQINYEKVVEQLGQKLMVKPANFGSSFGIEYADNYHSFTQALSKIFEITDKVIIESYVDNLELEFYVSGFNDFKVHSHYKKKLSGKYISYQTKYLTKTDNNDYAPPEFTPQKKAELDSIAMAAYKVCECNLYARVDLFLTPDGKVFVNETNTIPTIDNGANTAFFSYVIDMAFERHKWNQKYLKRTI